jgi:hypothetical protein
MSYKEPPSELSWKRIALWGLNIPFGLVAFYLSFYSFAGLWNPQTPMFLWLWAAAQAPIALISWLASSAKQADGQTNTANRLLLLPFTSLILWILAMQIAV